MKQKMSQSKKKKSNTSSKKMSKKKRKLSLTDDKKKSSKKNTKNTHRKKSLKKNKQAKRRKKKLKRLIVDISLAFSITLLLSSILFFTFFQFAKVNGYGMLPTLSDNDLVLIKKFETYNRFQLVYINSNKNEKVVQRIIGLPGESINYRDDTLYVDTEEKAENFILDEINEAKKSEILYTENFTVSDITNQVEDRIPKGKYLVLGDNRPFSSDSRYFGLVDEKDIVGVVKMRILPLHKMSGF